MGRVGTTTRYCWFLVRRLEDPGLGLRINVRKGYTAHRRYDRS